MLHCCTISFFGHRYLKTFFELEQSLETLIENFMQNQPYVEFLVGRNGAFDQLASSVIRRMQDNLGSENSSHVLVLPYSTAEYRNNREALEAYYDEIEISPNACIAHYKAALQIRNREMVDRSDLVVCWVEQKHSGAYQTMQYAQKMNKDVINLAKTIES